MVVVTVTRNQISDSEVSCCCTHRWRMGWKAAVEASYMCRCTTRYCTNKGVKFTCCNIWLIFLRSRSISAKPLQWLRVLHNNIRNWFLIHFNASNLTWKVPSFLNTTIVNIHRGSTLHSKEYIPRSGGVLLPPRIR